ncbi:hypothetical protein MLD38_007012 [Melastoma candidum]|uniref:Uncharacterized protein n=1 Tax=Melastoma candidum TaxID=119954 RepID=A0ACB9RR28_9MYRT|nr:hypothetical protein MLD38_007012 [Melastoma candidum]
MSRMDNGMFCSGDEASQGSNTCVPGGFPYNMGQLIVRPDMFCEDDHARCLTEHSVVEVRGESVSRFRAQPDGPLLGHCGNPDPQVTAVLEHFGEASMSSAYLQDHLNCLAVSSPSEDFLHGLSSGPCASFPASEHQDVVGSSKFGCGRIPRLGCSPLVGWISPEGFDPRSCYVTPNPNNELSLSLATSKPSGISLASTSDQSSDISSGEMTQRSMNHSKELSLSASTYSPTHFSPFIVGSKYLTVIQEILAEVASYSLENLDCITFPTSGLAGGTGIPCSSNFRDPDNRPDEPVMVATELKFRKSQLLGLLQMVDDRYNQCLDEIHTVISAFHAATELDPKVHACFALRTISILYKNIRERISGYILAMGEDFGQGTPKERSEKSFEASFIQRQWTLQQLKRKDHHLWRPQRGLPEKSVSVLRAWMFQNFLHPYPKDAEKHLLALKSGLSRSQVSNWFINARVRLWKPMIEEMYSEMNGRAGRWREDMADGNNPSPGSLSGQSFIVNG